VQLMIIRHATAVPRGTPGIADDERPLTKGGEKQWKRAARGLARVARRPDVLLTSPLPRAARTAEIAAKAWRKLTATQTPALQDGSFEAIAAAIGEYPTDSTVAIVGHEPDLSAFLARLLGTPNAGRLTFRKGGAALVDVPGEIADGGALTWYLSPRILRRLGR
jgi:phosphohistidine phosphatase